MVLSRDAREQLRERRRGDAALRDLEAVLVERARQIAHHPVGGELRLAAEALHDRLVVVGDLAARGQHAGVVGGEPVLRDEARGLLVRQLRQRRAHRFDHRLVDHQRQQVRVGEVAVVVRLFLGAHRARLAAVRVVEARLLHDLAAALDQLDLALDLVVDRALDEAERVEVLDLGARAELLPGPCGRTETLASQRNEPSCMLPSQISR